MKTYVLGDIHGAHKALVQCLERSGFNREQDRLIVLGDVCDGYPDVKRSIDELLALKDFVYIIGNHDLWALEWAVNGTEKSVWLTQGGANTIASYEGKTMPPAHVELLKTAHPWIEYEGKLFVHGGIEPEVEIAQQDLEFLVWDRSFVQDAWLRAQQDPAYVFPRYKEIFVGHTPTQNFAWLRRSDKTKPGRPGELSDEPLFLCNAIMMDTGAGWSGKLTIMDINTHEYWQSDPTPLLYGKRGR